MSHNAPIDIEALKARCEEAEARATKAEASLLDKDHHLKNLQSTHDVLLQDRHALKQALEQKTALQVTLGRSRNFLRGLEIKPAQAFPDARPIPVSPNWPLSSCYARRIRGRRRL